MKGERQHQPVHDRTETSSQIQRCGWFRLLIIKMLPVDGLNTIATATCLGPSFIAWTLGRALRGVVMWFYMRQVQQT